jgi:predicted HTH transcriptional regulator
MDSTEARALLADLVDRGLARSVGEKKARVYVIATVADKQPEVEAVGPALWTDDELQPAPRRMYKTETARAPRRSRIQVASLIRAALNTSSKSVRALSSELGLTERQITYALDLLRERNEVELEGRSGQRDATYGLQRPQVH